MTSTGVEGHKGVRIGCSSDCVGASGALKGVGDP
jgi:hypothetical protein